MLVAFCFVKYILAIRGDGMEQRIVSPLKNGVSLVAEASTNPDFPCEIYVGLMKDGVWIQDLCAVTQEYQYENTATNVLVWSNENYEGYTHKFTVPERPDMLDESWENY